MPTKSDRHISLIGQWKLKDGGLTCKDERLPKDYRIAEPRGELKHEIPINVPGDNYSALLAAGLIDNPYWSSNEWLLQWPRDHTWIMTKEFQVSQDLLSTSKQVWFQVEQLDVIADVKVNGKLISGENRRDGNQHRRWEWECKEALNVGNNVVEVIIYSAVYEACIRAERQPYFIPWSGDSNNKVPYMNLIRKTQCSAGWDWGICLLTSGIYGDLCGFEFVKDVKVDYVWTSQEWKGDVVVVDVFVQATGSGVATTTLDGNTVEGKVEDGVSKIASININSPRKWWPNGHGKQELYDLIVKVGPFTIEKSIGLRKVEWLNQPDKSGGISMKIRVNDVEIFCKGANWIPADAMPEKAGDRWKACLDSAVEANMNMIRIWGGGEFPRDEFYTMCDERGIMIWHDMMFSCSLYPADQAFLQEVTKEVEHQCKRLRDHASIVLWCGDNECIGALTWYPESRKNRDRYLINWNLLSRAIDQGVKQGDPGRMFWPSSPCSGPGDFSDNWHDDNKGDMHYWAVWHSGEGFESYYKVIPRFCSEFGYQSFPDFPLVRTFCPKEHWNVTSPSMDNHQKNIGGNSKIVEMFTRNFRMPTSFHNMLWLSQCQQAMIISRGVEYWRSNIQLCMGTLYWQLNDNWPVSSWSSLAHGGGWKQLQYHAKRFNQTVIVSGFCKPGKGKEEGEKGVVEEEVEIWVVNDGVEEFKGKIKVEVLELDGKVVNGLFGEYDVKLGGNESKEIVRKVLKDLGSKSDLSKRFVRMDLNGEIGGKPIKHSNVLNLARWKEMDLLDPGLEFKVLPKGEGFTVEVTATTAPAFFVTVEFLDKAPPGHFDDNSICFNRGESRLLTWQGETGWIPKAEEVWLGHLYASYQ